jgi:hypothetical protein
MIAALYVQKGGAYYGLPDVDPWDEERDARRYNGPWPVVAHPPCERWGRYWGGGPSAKVKRRKGDDGGCFAAALEAVRRFGGVLEHPADTHAWPAFGLEAPTRGGWSRALFGDPGWVCEVAQSAYGHRARKLTWLYYVGNTPPPALDWRRPRGARLDEGFHSAAERRAARAAGVTPRKRLSTDENIATPIPFRDLLISIAKGARDA